MLNSEEIKPIQLSYLCLAECISLLEENSAKNKIKIPQKPVEVFRVT